MTCAFGARNVSGPAGHVRDEPHKRSIMNDHELDGLLKASDPAGATPTTLPATIDELVSTVDEELPRPRWRPVVVAGGALALVGALAAGTDLGSYVLSIPPFAGLDYGSDFRTFEGMPYIPLSGGDVGEPCLMYIELGGITDAQATEVADLWPAIDPDDFAAAVGERMENPDPLLPSDPTSVESGAVRDEILARLDDVVPGIQWGATAPGGSFDDDDPHLVSWITSCVPLEQTDEVAE